jgi:hypothetical protein
MKNIKNILMALSMIVCAQVAIGMVREQKPESDLEIFVKARHEHIVKVLTSMQIPADARLQIERILISSKSEQEAMKAFRALSMVNRNFNNLFKDKRIYDQLSNLALEYSK